MRPRRRGGWRGGRKKQGKQLSLYRTCLEVGWRHDNIILHDHQDRGGGVLCRWRHTMSVAEEETKREAGTNCEEV